eukprot:GCRY01002243.1.p1 GENE.GCRY01002243.1~~GCRY01002243.1.p1  ORF type:complete len:220 (+),score=3.70 GCRY01002243.1:27-686(+)
MMRPEHQQKLSLSFWFCFSLPQLRDLFLLNSSSLHKFFNTTVIMSHPITPCTFWVTKKFEKNMGEYGDNIKKIATVTTLEEFWAVYSHLKPPSALPNGWDYSFFKNGIRPLWEDEKNKSGGKWIIHLKKGTVCRFWEELLLAIVGGQFDEGFCGTVLSCRQHEDILSVWNENVAAQQTLQMRDTMKRVLRMPSTANCEYKHHDQSIKDRSSFRNVTSVF